MAPSCRPTRHWIHHPRGSIRVEPSLLLVDEVGRHFADGAW